jgi:hypothetical protein
LRARTGSGREARARSVVVAAALLTLGDQVLGDLGLPLQPRQPRLLVPRATCSPAANRRRMTAITRRFAAALVSNTQVGNNSTTCEEGGASLGVW